MPSQDKLYLTASLDSSNALTELFSFTWPSAVALWNLQWQTKGFLAQTLNATVEQLNGRFVSGSGISGVNLRGLARSQTWHSMQNWFARLILSETCALFEGWVEAALDELQIPPAIRDFPRPRTLDKTLQFPTGFDQAGNVASGAQGAVDKIQDPNGSLFFQACILPSMLGHLKQSFLSLDNLLVCYRVFKEIRNDLTHHGGRASQKTLDAFSRYQNETAGTLDLKEKPILITPALNETIELSLRGVVGLGDVVLRLIPTYDFLMADSQFAEDLLKRRWKVKHGGRITLKPAGQARDGQLVAILRKCGAFKPTNPELLFSYLHDEGLVI